MYPNQRNMRPPCQTFNPQMARPPPPRAPFSSCPWQMPQNQPPPPGGFRPNFPNRPPPARQSGIQRNNNSFGPGNNMFGSGPVNSPVESFPFSAPPPPHQANFQKPPPNFQNPPPNFQNPPPNFQNRPPGQPLPFNQAPRPHLSFQHQQQHVRGGGQFQAGGRGIQNAQGLRGGFRGRGRGQAGNPAQRGGNNNNGGKKQKKEKVDKRDLPENNAFFCDTCDRGFKTEEKYREHVDGHQKCSFKDCPFIAAPKLVQIHMTLQHRQGFAKKIYSLESPEDVAKWREERKKKFPTADNIGKKNREREDKIARGEVIETKDFSKMKQGRGRGRGKQNRGRQGNGRGRWKEFDQTDEVEDIDEDDAPTEVKIKRPQAEGSIDTKTDRVSCDQSSTPVALVNDLSRDSMDAAATPAVSLSLLSGNGASSGEGSDNEDAGDIELLGSLISGASQLDPLARLGTSSSQHTNTSVSSSGKPTTSSARHNVLLSELKDTLCAAADTAIAAAAESVEEETEPEPVTNGKPLKRKRKGDNRNPKKAKQNEKRTKKQKQQPTTHKRKYTLLEKLLAPDIRRERNKILQCVHFIVKHNFFGENNTDSAK